MVQDQHNVETGEHENDLLSELAHFVDGKGPLPVLDDRGLDCCRRHGVLPLVAFHGVNARQLDTTLQDLFAEVLNAETVREKLQLAEAKRIMQLFSDHDIPCIVLKGMVMAYHYYPEPYLRPRGDTDLMIRRIDRVKVNELMLDEQYVIYGESEVRYQSYQRCYQTLDQFGLGHTFDVHWELNNRQLIAHQFSFDELIKMSCDFDKAIGAQCLSPVYQLLHLLLHRAVHLNGVLINGKRMDGDRLIWLYDIALLARVLTKSNWRELKRLSQEKGITSIVAHGLDATSFYFSIDVMHPWQLEKDKQEQDAGQSLLIIRRFQPILADLEYLSGLAKLKFLQEVILPNPQNILTRYGKSSRLWLPILYPYRLIAAFRHLLPSRNQN